MKRNHKTSSKADDFFGFSFACLAACVVLITVVVAPKLHELECLGKGKCGWAWCQNYNGSDYMHDFNF